MADVLVIGGGPGGYMAAERASHAGLETIVIEKASLGGVCLNEGCVPTKTLLYSAKLADGAEHGKPYGVYATDVSVNHKEVVNRKNKVVRKLVAGVKAVLKGCTVIQGTAEKLVKTAEGFSVTVGEETYSAKKIIIASGSVPVIPPIEGLKEGLEKEFILTNREILNITEPPQELVVIGGGVIGLEMASYFNSLKSKVTVIEMIPEIGGNIDADLSETLRNNYEKKGVIFNLNCKVVKFSDGEVYFEKDGETQKIPADKVLLSIGRKANIDGLELEALGVEIERGRIVTNDSCETSIEGIYAAGDVNGKYMLAHVAYREAETCVRRILGEEDSVNYNAVAGVIYTNPEVAFVGETEETAKQKGYNTKVVKLSNQFSGRYVAENERGDGFSKIIVDTDKNVIIGGQMIGNYASEIIFQVATFIQAEMKIEDIKKLIFPHPTVCEMFRELVWQS